MSIYIDICMSSSIYLYIHTCIYVFIPILGPERDYLRPKCFPPTLTASFSFLAKRHKEM